MKRRANPSGRDADPRRTLPLNSAAWRRLRALVLADNPLCLMCERMGRVTLATDVDHHDGNPGNNDRSNLVPLCHSCHSHKTMRERHGKSALQGCDLSGMPLDPNHPWNAAPRAFTRVAAVFDGEKSPETKNPSTGRSTLFAC